VLGEQASAARRIERERRQIGLQVARLALGDLAHLVGRCADAATSRSPLRRRDDDGLDREHDRDVVGARARLDGGGGCARYSRTLFLRGAERQLDVGVRAREGEPRPDPARRSRFAALERDRVERSVEREAHRAAPWHPPRAVGVDARRASRTSAPSPHDAHRARMPASHSSARS
jgi:hypothetical protein